MLKINKDVFVNLMETGKVIIVVGNQSSIITNEEIDSLINKLMTLKHDSEIIVKSIEKMSNVLKSYSKDDIPVLKLVGGKSESKN